MSRVEYGHVDIDLGDEVITLKPTLKAIMKIERHFGGMRNAIESCGNLSVEGAWVIISAGANIKPNDENMQEKVLMGVGMSNILPHVSEYLMLLLNPTGKDAEEADQESGE